MGYIVRSVMNCDPRHIHTVDGRRICFTCTLHVHIYCIYRKIFKKRYITIMK